MAVIPILKMGNPLLFAKAQKVEDPTSKETKIIIENLIDTMRHFHGVGLAAPQIGINKRIIVYAVDNNPRYPKANFIPLTIFINPQVLVVDHSSKVSGLEGCLSLPNLRAEVVRYHEIFCTGTNEHGDFIESTAFDFEARIIQHECDHLDGILFPARIQNFKSFGFENELKNSTDNNLRYG